MKFMKTSPFGIGLRAMRAQRNAAGAVALASALAGCSGRRGEPVVDRRPSNPRNLERRI
jgi:hypothetical protein